eukprot:Pgem_evm1s8123
MQSFTSTLLLAIAFINFQSSLAVITNRKCQITDVNKCSLSYLRRYNEMLNTPTGGFTITTQSGRCLNGSPYSFQ